jgi:hypothetical protein
MDDNPTAATYHPIQGMRQLGKAAPLGGGSPAMYWYGFVARGIQERGSVVPDLCQLRG